MAELTRMDTQCLDLREACVGSSEHRWEWTQGRWSNPGAHPHFMRLMLWGKHLNIKMKQDKPPHYLVCLFLSQPVSFLFLSLALLCPPISLYPLLSSASSPGFISCSAVFAFSFTFPASCGCAEIVNDLKCLPRVTAPEREGEGGLKIARVYLAVGSVFPQGSSCIINAESFLALHSIDQESKVWDFLDGRRTWTFSECTVPCVPESVSWPGKKRSVQLCTHRPSIMLRSSTIEAS